METLAQAAQAALDVQSACNLSGVLHSFSAAVKVLRAQPDFKGTDWVNHHPISVLFATQIASLTRVAIIADEACDYSSAYTECQRLAKNEPLTPKGNLMSTEGRLVRVVDRDAGTGAVYSETYAECQRLAQNEPLTPTGNLMSTKDVYYEAYIKRG